MDHRHLLGQRDMGSLTAHDFQDSDFHLYRTGDYHQFVFFHFEFLIFQLYFDQHYQQFLFLEYHVQPLVDHQQHLVDLDNILFVIIFVLFDHRCRPRISTASVVRRSLRRHSRGGLFLGEEGSITRFDAADDPMRRQDR
jgi:hypothetical protein